MLDLVGKHNAKYILNKNVEKNIICKCIFGNVKIGDSIVNEVFNSRSFWYQLLEKKYFGVFVFLLENVISKIDLTSIRSNDRNAHPILEFFEKISTAQATSAELKSKYLHYISIMMNILYNNIQLLKKFYENNDKKITSKKSTFKFFNNIKTYVNGNLKWYADDTIWDVDELTSFINETMPDLVAEKKKLSHEVPLLKAVAHQAKRNMNRCCDCCGQCCTLCKGCCAYCCFGGLLYILCCCGIGSKIIDCLFCSGLGWVVSDMIDQFLNCCKEWYYDARLDLIIANIYKL